MQKTSEKKDIYHIYELEARNFNEKRADFFWSNFFKTAGVFIFTIFVVYFIINFRFMSSQLADWHQGKNYMIASIFYEDKTSTETGSYLISKSQPGEDADGDGLADELERFLGTKVDEIDSDGDGVDDYQEFAAGRNPLGSGQISGEIINKENSKLIVRWSNNDLDEIRRDLRAVKASSEKLPFSGDFLVYPGETLPGHLVDSLKIGDEIMLNISYGDNMQLEAVYRTTNIEIFEDLNKADQEFDGIRLIHGWPKGSDWKRKIFSAKLIKINQNN